MKKLSFLFVALIACMTLSAQNAYQNVNGSFAWAVGNEQNAAVSDNIAGAVQESRVGVGSDLTTGTKSDYAVNSGNTMVTYQPGTCNAGCIAADMVEYKVKMKKGLTFQLTGVTYDALKDGTDAAHYSWSYTVDGVESTPIEVLADSVLRNNGANAGTASLNHSEAITAAAGREVTFRIYISHTANNKKIAVSNVNLTGVVNGEEVPRTFQNFTLELRNQTSIESLPAGVTLMNTPAFNGAQHGYVSPVFQVVVDGPVRFKIGGCTYAQTSCTVYDGDSLLATIDVSPAGCDNGPGTYQHFVTYVYNSETPTTLTINCAQYCPYIIAEACDLIPLCYVSYYDTDGRTLLHKDTVEGNSPLAFSVGVEAVTVPLGSAFRGWFNSPLSTAVKVAEGTAIQEDLSLYAKATPIEVCTNTARFIYDLTKTNFYVEDHECIEMPGGKWHDSQHGWDFGNGGKIILPVAGKALITIGNCRYSGATVATVTNAAGVELDTFTVKAPERSFP